MINVTCGIPNEETHQRVSVTQVGQWHMGGSCRDLGRRQRVNQQKTWINFFITLLIFGVLALFFYRQVMTL